LLRTSQTHRRASERSVEYVSDRVQHPPLDQNATDTTDDDDDAAADDDDGSGAMACRKREDPHPAATRTKKPKAVLWQALTKHGKRNPFSRKLQELNTPSTWLVTQNARTIAVCAPDSISRNPPIPPLHVSKKHATFIDE